MDTPAKFFAGLREPLAGMGQCSGTITSGSQQHGTAELSLQEPVAARINLPGPPSLTRIIVLDGKTYVHGGARTDDLWHDEEVGALIRVIGEMDCRSVVSNLEKVTRSVDAVGPTMLADHPADEYEITYDRGSWSSVYGLPKPSGTDIATMKVWVRQGGQLAQIRPDAGVDRSVSYTWFPGRPEIAAPGPDQVADATG